MKNQFSLIKVHDLPAVSEFISRHLDSPPSLFFSGLDRLRECMDYLDIKHNVSFMLTGGGEIRGIFLAAYRAQNAYIPLIVVHKELRHQGYGKVLLQKGLSYLAGADCTRVMLEVLPDNLQAVSLYQSEGFEIRRTIVTYRNDSASYYKGLDPRTTLVKEQPFTFQPLYRTYGVPPRPWIRGLRTLQAILDRYNGELYRILQDNKSAGYVVLLREKGTIRILDMALGEYRPELISYALARLSEGEKVLTFRSLYETEPLGECLGGMGFYIYTRQYEMTKELR